MLLSTRLSPRPNYREFKRIQGVFNWIRLGFKIRDSRCKANFSRESWILNPRRIQLNTPWIRLNTDPYFVDAISILVFTIVCSILSSLNSCISVSDSICLLLILVWVLSFVLVVVTIDISMSVSISLSMHVSICIHTRIRISIRICSRFNILSMYYVVDKYLNA